MAWQDALIPMVRTLVGDLGDTQTYSDGRIEQTIMTAGIIASQELEFDRNYTFDFVNNIISPDPTDPNAFDPEMMALITLKAACLLNLNAYQLAVGTGIRVRDGDSEVDTTGAFKGYSDILRLGACAAYDKLLKALYFSQAKGKAVMTPISRFGLYGNGIWNSRGFFNYIGQNIGGYSY